MRREAFWVAVILLLFAVIVQIRIAGLSAVIPDVVLAVLVAASGVLGFGELIVLALFSSWALNWQPRIGMELVLLVAIPLVARLLRPFLPWQGWFSNVMVVGIAALVFHGAVAGRLILALPGPFFLSWVITLTVGAFAFQVLRVARWAAHDQLSR